MFFPLHFTRETTLNSPNKVWSSAVGSSFRCISISATEFNYFFGLSSGLDTLFLLCTRGKRSADLKTCIILFSKEHCMLGSKTAVATLSVQSLVQNWPWMRHLCDTIYNQAESLMIKGLFLEKILSWFRKQLKYLRQAEGVKYWVIWDGAFDQLFAFYYLPFEILRM